MTYLPAMNPVSTKFSVNYKRYGYNKTSQPAHKPSTRMHKAKHLSTKPPHNLQYPTKPSHKLQYPTKHNSNYHFPNSRVKTPTDGYTNANSTSNLRESFHNSEFNYIIPFRRNRPPMASVVHDIQRSSNLGGVHQGHSPPLRSNGLRRSL